MRPVARVLMIVPQFPPPVLGGLEGQAFELSNALVRLGVPVRVLSGRIQRHLAPPQPPDELPVTRIPFPRRTWLRAPITGCALVYQLVARRREYDVVHAHNLSWFGGLSVVVAKLLRKPVLAKLPTERRRAFRDGSLRLRLFQSCDAVALLSPDAVADLRQLGYPEQRIFRITNGVSTTRFSPPERARGQDPSRPLTALFIGRLERGKGLLDLLAIWPSVQARSPGPVRLVVCGAGPQEQELRAAIAAAGLAASVAMRGRIADVPAALREADVFVLPSYAEGNSNAVLEAMASGLPIVSTTAGGTPLLVGAEGLEWLVTPGDRPALEDRIVRLLDDPVARAKTGEAMWRRARQELGIDAVAERYRCVYERLAAGERDAVASCSTKIF